MRKTKRILAIMAAVILLCINMIPLTASAASVLDATGVVEIFDSSGSMVAALPSAAVELGDIKAVFASTGIPDDVTCQFYSPSTKKSYNMSLYTADDYIRCYQLSADADIPLLKLGTYSGGKMYVVYYNSDSAGMTSAEVEIDKDFQNGIVRLKNVPSNLYSGCALLDGSTGEYIGMLITYTEDSNKYAVLMDYYVTGDGKPDDTPEDTTEDDPEDVPEDTPEDTPEDGGSDTGSKSGSGITITITTAGILVAIGVVLLLLFLHSKNKSKEEGNNMAIGDNFAPLPGDAPARRLCIRGEGGYFDGRKFELDGSITIGRQQERCNICYPIDAKGISGIHCQLRKIGDQVELIDLGSSYGTFVNGQMITPNTAVMLNAGDRFWLASEKNTFVVYR